MSDTTGNQPEQQPGQQPGHGEQAAPPPAPGYHPGSPPPPGWGQPYPSYPPGYGYGYPPARSPHPLATTSLVLGIIALAGMLVCGVTVLLGPVAVVLALVAMNAIRKQPQRYSGQGLAIGGLVTGLLATLLMILFVVGMAWLFASVPA